MQRGPQQKDFDLQFCVPSECARRVESGMADLGIVPVAEMARQGLQAVPGTGIACRGAVRSILLVSRVEPAKIRTLACDAGSRTSVRLARVILAERFGAVPATFEQEPVLDRMLERADAALVIGDAALRIEPAALPNLACLDLGEEWWRLTGLPMVFALWAGQPGRVSQWNPDKLARLFAASLDYGMAHLEEIASSQAAALDFRVDLVREYLTRHIVFRIGAAEEAGLAEFLRLSARLDAGASAPAAMLRSESVSTI